MANRSVVVDLIIRTGAFTSGMRRASRDMASDTTNMETKVRALQMQIGLLGVGMVAFAAIAVKKWADFDQAMSRVEATGGEAAARIDELNDAAKSDEVIALGYNAVQASNGIYELTKAGVSATDIIGGGMAGAMSLAAAETMDAAESAQIMASALTQFNLDGSDAAHVADLITAAAGKAQGSAHDLGFALKQSGLVANQFGLSVEETTGTLALFASAGLIGSDAGTSLRTMLLHLAGPSTKAAKLMNEIGLEVYKSNGEMVSMEELADNLQSSMGKLSEEQRNQALATIFGADATRAASLLYREGGDAVQSWIEKVDDAGYAQDVARKRMDNLNGDVKKLSATFDRSMIAMGESADAPLRKVVSGITEAIDWFGNLSPAIQGVIMALTGGGGLVILATLGIGQVVAALGSLQAGLIATGVITQATAAKMAIGFGRAAKAAGVMVAAFLAVQAAAAVFGEDLDPKSASEWAKSLLDASSAADLVGTRLKGVVGTTFSLDEAWKRLTDPSRGQAFDDWSGDLINMNSSADLLTAEFESMGQALATLYASDPALAAEKFRTVLAATGASNKELLEYMPAYKDALDATTVSQELAAVAAGGESDALESLGASVEAITAAEVEAQKAHEEYIGAIVNSFTSFFGLSDVYQGVIDGQKAIAESAAESSESTEDSWEDFYDGAAVSADQYIAELQRQVEAQEAWASNLISLTERVKGEMPANLQVAAQEMINELRDLGPEGAAQVALLESMSAEQLASVVDLFNRQGTAAGEEWAAGVEAVEDPEVDVDTKKATSNLQTLQQKLDQAAGRRVVIPFDANIGPALSKIATLQAKLSAVAGAQVAIPYSSETHRATGGAVFGPGTATSDSIPARLSDGEHVLTASDVQKAGGQDAIYRMRGAIQSGVLKFAAGGAVNGATMENWRAAYLDYPDRLRLLAQIRSQEETLDKGEVTGFDRAVLVNDLEENRRRLYHAEYAASMGDTAFWAKMPQRDKYSKEMQRGEFTKGLTSGRSGAISSLDEIRNSAMPVAGAEVDRLNNALIAAEKSANALYDEMDSVDKKIEDAADKAQELRSISNSVQSGLVGGFGLDSVAQTAAVNPFTGEVTGGGAGSAGQGMLRSAQTYAAKVKAFAGRLKSLADKGFAGVILQEIASMGVDAGMPAADALLGLDLGDTAALNRAYEDIASFGGQAGQAVTEGFYKGGVAAADGLVAGLDSQKEAVQEAIMRMALTMQVSLRKALGIASPARKIRDEMKFVGQGAVLGLDDQHGIVGDAFERLFSPPTVRGRGGFYGGSGSGSGAAGDVTAHLSDEQVERLAVAFETGNVRNINRSTAQKNRRMELTYGARGR